MIIVENPTYCHDIRKMSRKNIALKINAPPSHPPPLLPKSHPS